jgi:hypothetical protein
MNLILQNSDWLVPQAYAKQLSPAETLLVSLPELIRLLTKASFAKASEDEAGLDPPALRRGEGISSLAKGGEKPNSSRENPNSQFLNPKQDRNYCNRVTISLLFTGNLTDCI